MKRGRRSWFAAITAVALVIATAVVWAAPAYAADGDVEIQKTASVETVEPGQTFSYTIVVSCTSILAGCADATLTDPVPDEFEVLGATIGTGLQGDLTIDGQTVNVDFTMPMIDGNTGLPAGTTGTVTIQVRARDDLPYEANGIPVPNTATTDASTQTSGPIDSTAEVTPVVPLDLQTTTDKTMDPASAVAAPGTPVTATVTTTNDSNANVDTIVITDPVDPTAAPNPFEQLPFTGITSITYPAGAETAQVEVWDGTEWVSGPVATAPTTPQPPASVADEDVRGVRITFSDTDGNGIPPTSSAGVSIGMQHPADVQSNPDSVTVTNTAQGEVSLGTDTASGDDSATHQIVAENVDVMAGKSFSPAQVPAGGDSVATITAGNASQFPLTDLTVTEPSLTGSDPHVDGFDSSMQFTGFTDGITYPAGATGATITYYYDDGTTSDPLGFGDGDVPPDPGGTVVRFEITFTGDIQPGAQTAIPFGVTTDPDQAGFPAVLPNQITVDGTGPNGGEASSTAEANLQVFERHIETITDKSIYPDSILDRPGEWVLVTLSGQIAPFPQSTTDATQVIVQDPEVVPYDVDGTFWDEFNATEITQTAVPSNATLSINYWDGTEWVPLPGAQDIEGPTTPPEFTMAIPADLQDDILGLQFVYTAKPGESFSYGSGTDPGASFEPHFSGEKRDEERDPATQTTAPDAVPNCDTSSASSAEVTSTPTVGATACDEVPLVPIDDGGGGGPDVLDKQITPEILTSRSEAPATITLHWSTGGYSNVDAMTVQDEATPPSNDPASVAGSFYDAFDIVGVPAITATMDTHLKFDAVTAVQLWDGTAWRALENDPCAGTACVGAFPGVTLTTSDREAALGIRLVFAESPDRAAVSVGDLTAPPVGSGVARSSGNDRQVQISVELRDTRRSDGAPAMGSLDYNVDDGDPAVGTVGDQASAAGVTDGDQVIGTTDSDTIGIIDVPLNVSLDKTWSDSPFGVPPDGVPQSEYPTGLVTLVATNQTASKVDSLVIDDPSPGAPENPFTYFNVQSFRNIPVVSGANADSPDVILSRDTDGDGAADSTDTLTRTAALALTEAQLTDVVGVRIEYQGRIAAGASAIVQVNLRLREFVRGQPGVRVDQSDSPVDNAATATVDDAGGGTADNITSDDDTASVDITNLTLTVTATKTFTPDTQSELDDSPVVMTLAGQPTGSARTYGMLVEDSTPTFWNAFDYVGISPSFQLAAPINLVRMDVYTGGTFADDGTDAVISGGSWVTGDWKTQADFAVSPLPGGVTPDQVQGVRFSFLDDPDGDGQNGEQWENPTTPLQQIPISVQRRTDLRSGGEVPSDRPELDPAPGEAAPGEFSNEQTTTICSFLGACQPGIAGTAEASASDQMHLTHAESAVEISKTPTNGSAFSPDEVIPYTITVTNTGQWPVENPVIVDDPLQDGQLMLDPLSQDADGPYEYALAGAAPAPPTGLPMPIDPADVTVDTTGGNFTFTFPQGTVLEVGQTYTITIDLVFATGVPGGTVVSNDAAITGDRPFDSCNGGADRVGECSATTDVVVISAGATRSGKLVRALDDELGAFSNAEGGDCSIPNAPPITDPDGEGFYRAPCVPIVKPGGLLEWRLAILNTGNIPMDHVVLADRLPAPGDTGLLSGLARGSEWTPIFTGDITLRGAPAGTVPTYLVTTGDVCADDLPNTLTPACPAGSWVALGTVDPADVTGIEVVLDFPDGVTLDPGEGVAVDYQTYAPPVSPTAGPDTIAWNTVATGAHLTAAQSNGSSDMTPIEGTRVGAALATGSLQVLKTASGDGAAFAPDTFAVQLQCTSAIGTPVEETLPPIDLTLTAGETQDVDDLPWGAQCTLVEGDNGQTASSGNTAVVGDPDAGPLQTASLDNVYELASLQLTKAVTSDAVDQNGDAIPYGPFEASVSCTFLGEPVWGEDYTASPMVVEIADGQTTTITGLPAGAECAVSETDTDGATSVVVNGATADGAVGPGDASGITVTVTPDDDGEPTNSVDIENVFSVGSIEILKVIDPEGSIFASGPYVVHVSCTLDGDSTWDGNVVFDAAADDPATVDDDTDFAATITNVATGSLCEVTETDNGFATTSTVSPSSVTIGDDATVTVTVTNFFPEGSLTVTKQLAGDTTWAPTSYTVRLTCLDPTSDRPLLAIPGGPTRELTEATGYTATYSPLPAGAVCVLVETDPGGAASTAIQDENGNPVGLFTIQGDVERSFTVVNTFETGQLQVTKQTSGDGAALWGTNGFEIELSCIADVGDGPVAIDIPGGAVRTITAGETVTYDELPPGAQCSVVETGDGGASSVKITPNDGADTTTGIATVDADNPVTLVIDNTFDVGQLTVQKVISGDGAQWANGDFVIELSCTWNGSGTAHPIAIPGGAQRTLSRATALSTTYDDLPDGAICSVSETDEADASDVSINPGQVTVSPGATVTITIDNRFDAGSIHVVKTVSGPGADIGRDTVFTVQLSCESTISGNSGSIPIPGGAERQLRRLNGFSTTFDGLPNGAQCVLAEIDDGGATRTTFSPDEGSVTVAENQTVELSVDNYFDSGGLVLLKTVDGSGAAYFGGGPFTFHMVCTLQTSNGATRTVYDDDIVLGGDDPLVTTINGIPTGSVCDIAETDDSVADQSIIDDPEVVIGTSQAPVEVDATNTFLTGSVTVDKVVTGGGAAQFGQGPFEVTIRCIDPAAGIGDPTPIDIPGGAVRSLDAGNDYSATYETLPAGAICGIAETDDGGADAKRLLNAAGDEIGLITLDSGSRVGFFRVQADTDLSFVLENTFDPAPPPLPATGVDGRLWSEVALIAVMIAGGGLVLILTGTRRRRRRNG